MQTNSLTLGRAPQRFARSAFDWLFALTILAGGAYAFARYAGSMDIYERAILLGTVLAVIALGWFWGSLRVLVLGVGLGSLVAIGLYNKHLDGFGADLGKADQVFLLKYFLSSQSAILWMSVLVFMSTTFYWLGFAAKSEDSAAGRIGSWLAWAAVFMALTGTMVRWFESHQIGPDIGHIPVSNLYEVFVLFCWMTTLFYLYYEQHYATRALGAFVMLVVSAAVGFLLWYTIEREAQKIQPLVPALQSWWMKLHVPANFIGYGSFSLSAMVAFAYLIKRHAAESQWRRLLPLFLVGIVLCLEPLVFRKPAHSGTPAFVRGPRRPDVQVDSPRLRVLHDRHDRHDSGSLLGSGGLGWLLELGSQRDLGVNRVAQLRGVAAHATHERYPRNGFCVVGPHRAGGHDVCVPWRQHVFVGTAFLRNTLM